MTKVKIPRSVKGVTDELGQISELLTATEWKRAALLASVVRLTGSGNSGNAVFHTSESFADLGIIGLRRGGTVRLYVQRWLDANDGEYPRLGTSITLPSEDWPPGDRDAVERVGPGRLIRDLVEGINTGRVDASAVAEAVVGNETLDTAVSRERIKRVRTPAERAEADERAKAREKDLDTAVGASHAGLSDHIDHEVELELITVIAHLRRAVSKMEQFPYFSPSQQERVDDTLDSVNDYVDVLRKGANGQAMSDADREFLESAGVES